MSDPTTAAPDNTKADSTTTSTVAPLLTGKTETDPAKGEGSAAAPAATETTTKEGEQQTPEQKAEADQKAAADAEKAKLVGAPEKYESFTAPQGVTLNSELVNEFTPLAKNLNLSQEGAQKIADFGVKLIQKQSEATAKQWVDTRAAWTTQIKSDKEVGGNNYSKASETAYRGIGLAMKTIPELKAVVDQGWFDNPALFKMAHLLGKTVREDRFIDGGAASERELTAAEILYPKTNKQTA